MCIRDSRYAAREKIVQAINAEGLAVMTTDVEGNTVPLVETKMIMQPFGDRSGVVIEPMLTDQWFADAATLAKPAIASVREGRTKFVPKNWEKTYFEWMENIQPWCISRQLWWGHQIPAWYGPDGTVFVEKTEEEALHAAIQHYISHEGPWKAWIEEKLETYKPGEILTRDEDVLDTWFSSALWPFSTLGWPDKTKELDTYYQTDVLVTGFDIIFFWVARMMMMGLHFMDEEPFHTVYVHALVRDKNGAKMSKSKGNVIDPLELIDEYGADALRFTLAIMAAQGRDVKLDPARIAGYRNFGTKLWNATRFAEMNGAIHGVDFDPASAKLPVNRWILTELTRTAREMTRAMEEYRFNEAAASAYRFVWNQVCDWYLELLKPVFMAGSADEQAEARACAGFVLDSIYRLLHPFMPFITEELWHAMGPRDHDLIVAKWPMADARALDPEASKEVDWLISLVQEIRTARNELNVPPGTRLPLHVRDANETTLARLERQAPALARLARVTHADGEATGGAAQVVVDEATFVLPLEGVIDLDSERARLTKAIAAAEKERDALSGRLGNASFVERAQPEAVEKAKADHADKAAEAARLQAALGRLG